MDWSLLRNLKLLCRPAFWVLQEWDCWLLSLPPCGHRPELLSHQYCCTHIRKALSNSGTSGRVYNVVAVRLHCGFWIFMKMNCWVITGWVMLWGRSIGRMWQMQWNSNVSSHNSSMQPYTLHQSLRNFCVFGKCIHSELQDFKAPYFVAKSLLYLNLQSRIGSSDAALNQIRDTKH
jgi:hypothetical protein